MQHKKLTEIKFPIYAITSSYLKIWEEFGVLYIRTKKEKILDNKNVDGATLGSRRAKISTDSLYKLKGTIFNVPQLLNSKYNVFIDTNGMVFKYVKHSFVPLKYHKVKSLIKKENGCIVSIKDTTLMLNIPYRDALNIKYVGILHSQLGDILYEFTDERKKDTRKKI